MLPRRNRIVEPKDFRSVIRHGDKIVSQSLIGYRLAGTGSRVGIIVTKSFGNAVARNTARRRARAIAAELIRRGKLTGDVVFRFRTDGESADFRHISSAITECVDRWSANA